MGGILDIRLEELQKQLDANEHRIQLSLDESAKQWLCERGYDPSYGARPLNRAIQVGTPLTRQRRESISSCG